MRTLTGFDTTHPDFDSKRYIRQCRGFVKWKKTGGRGTLQYATGVGKSTNALLVISKLLKKKNLKYGGTTLIVVPTISLKQQWEKHIKKGGFKNVTILVINTVALGNKLYTYDLLILDEIHLMGADKFCYVFKKVKYNWVLGLTATLERLDGKHIILEKFAPICDTISQKEAIQNGWISNFIQFNLAVPITQKEAAEQVNLGKQIRFYISRFGDFNKMLSCMDKRNALEHAQTVGEDYKDIMKYATQGIRLIHKRKHFLDNTEHKIKAAVELIKEFNVRTITFSQSTQFVDELSKLLGEEARVYHSNLVSNTIFIEQTKQCKDALKAKKLMKQLKSLDIDYKCKKSKGNFIITWLKPKRVSATTIAKRNLEDFVSNKYRVLLAAKAVDQGVDVPDVQLGISASRSENPATYKQICGRIARIYLDKNGKPIPKVFINLYVPDWSVPNSRDEQKIRLCQKDNKDDVYWVNDLQELKEMLESILKIRNMKF